jgi:hypothetical protein
MFRPMPIPTGHEPWKVQPDGTLLARQVGGDRKVYRFQDGVNPSVFGDPFAVYEREYVLASDNGWIVYHSDYPSPSGQILLQYGDSAPTVPAPPSPATRFQWAQSVSSSGSTVLGFCASDIDGASSTGVWRNGSVTIYPEVLGFHVADNGNLVGARQTPAGNFAGTPIRIVDGAEEPLLIPGVETAEPDPTVLVRTQDQFILSDSTAFVEVITIPLRGTPHEMFTTYRVDPDGQVSALPTLGTYTNADLYDVSETGIVLGQLTEPALGPNEPAAMSVMWFEGKVIPMESVLRANGLDWTGVRAWEVNDQGYIFGSRREGNETVPFVLSPLMVVPEPGFAGVVISVGVMTLRRRRG